MDLARLVMAFFGYVGLLAALASSMVLAARLTARVLGVPQFRWFAEPEQPVARWRLAVVRFVAALAPWLVGFCLVGASFWIGGVQAPPSTQVEVQEGAARAAGVQSGDRINRIGNERVDTWEQLRAAVQRQQGEVSIEIERVGQSLVLTATPRAGRLGIAPLPLYMPVGLGEAARRALPMPWTVATSAARSILQDTSGTDKPELREPVSIVQETAKAGTKGRGVAAVSFYLGLLASYLWPFFGGVALFDGVASAIFRKTYPRAASSGLQAYRYERLRQALLLVDAGYVAFLFSVSVASLGIPFTLGLAFSVMPSVFAVYPLTWIVGSQFWKPSSVVLCLLVALFVPCVPFLIVFELRSRLRSAIRAEGFNVTWLRAEPRGS